MAAKHNKFALVKVTPLEAQAIESMFRLYDYRATGKIPRYLAKKLTRTLGFEQSLGTLPVEVNLRDFLMFIDQCCPDTEPHLQSSLYSFTRLVCKQTEEGPMLTPQVISAFMESLGRPAASIGEATLLLTSMLDYDDCAAVPAVKAEPFTHDLTTFAKKNNALKDFA